MTSPKPCALIVLDHSAREWVYGDEITAQLRGRVDLVDPPMDASGLAAHPEMLQEVEIIFGGWGTPRIDESFLAAAPRLRAVFFAAGSIRQVATEASWRRGVTMVSAYAMNAIPTAEFALGAIILSLKHAWRYALGMQREHRFLEKSSTMPGAYGSTVGLIALGMAGRHVARLLRSLEVRVIAYDPYCDEAQARLLGVSLVSLSEVFERSDVVSLHAPWLKETERMITGEHFAEMKPGATFINTARGAIICEDQLIGVLGRRPDLTAVLDVTWPEPPVPGSPLFTLPNVVLTPHIAGSRDGECRRLGHCMVEELDRYLAGEPLRWSIERAQAERMA